MRHKSGLRKLNRTKAHRKALFRNMATSLLLHERCLTTVEKAKELRSVVEKLITTGKEDNLAARKKAYDYLKSKDVVYKLFTDIGPRLRQRNGGYTRIVRSASNRHGDAAAMAWIELVDAKIATKAVN